MYPVSCERDLNLPPQLTVLKNIGNEKNHARGISLNPSDIKKSREIYKRDFYPKELLVSKTKFYNQLFKTSVFKTEKLVKSHNY